jgi:hypothetical protein
LILAFLLSEMDTSQIRPQAVRLTRYCRRVKDKIFAGNRQDLIEALADCAETAEIARRLYQLIEQQLTTAHDALQPTRAPLKDVPRGEVDSKVQSGVAK